MWCSVKGLAGEQPYASGKTPERSKHPAKLQSWQGQREVFLGTRKGLSGVDATQDVIERCWAELVGWDFLCNAKKSVFSPSCLRLFQRQWGC